MLNRTVFSFIALLFFTTQISAQEDLAIVKEKPLYRAYYEYAHIKDTTTKNVKLEKMALLFGEKHALYFSYDKLLEHVAIDDYVKQQLAQGEEHVKIKAAKIITPEEILTDYATNDILINTYLARHFYYPKTITAPHWTISTEQKQILGLNCYKASLNYLGRTWQVWFTPEIAFPTGPWLLRGLPGLIVSASDDKGEVQFTLQALEEAATNNPVFERMAEYKVIQLTNGFRATKLASEKDLLKLKQTARKDIRSFQITQIHAMHELGGTLDYGVSNPYSWSAVISNPIDLTADQNSR
ncbi:GLPGLI family protein [Sphingobacterium allocomposti]|uniref:GLPGLI family protein n=1 Tax=Sphingobacterium allocomposti TaxID=415956 RepID=A0A5S5DKC1_9SPHI|nr:GLPGLI family protein [Sphingobacterium composti Yoo et al. 2007 non Ten et al. 2007]TYP96371.1 GLPGLI family protein [Sphingobacterium composti Yoo et al. 2007 non Ten et al. 2007]